MRYYLKKLRCLSL